MIDHATRDHAVVIASSAERWLHCPPSAVAQELYPRQDTKYTQEGTLAHEAAEVAARRQLLYETAELPPEGITDEMLRHADAYAAYIQELIKTPNPLVLIEQRVDFSPWVPEGFGTCDCILVQGDTLTVIDYKYGQGLAVSARDNPQMKLYALGAYNEYGYAFDVTRIEMHIFQPRIDNISSDSLTVDELLAWGEKTVKPTAALAAEGKGDYAPGEHCRFCGHKGHCQALTRACTEYVEANGQSIPVPKLAPYELADVLRMIPTIKLWIKGVEAQALSDLMAGEKIPGYKVVQGKAGNRTWTSEEKVLEVLTGAGYETGKVTETLLLSPAAMDKAITRMKVNELLKDYIHREPGNPSLATEDDKRPAYDREATAKEDFA